MPTLLNTLEYGDAGSPVVFLHGLFGQARNWGTLGKQLGETHRVTLVDLPQHGRSEWTDRWDWHEVVAAVAATIEAIGEPVALVGHSLGAKAAMLVALLRPELVERLGVVDMSPVNYRRLEGDLATYVDALAEFDLSTLTSREEAEERLAAVTDDATIRAFLLQNLRRDPDGPGGWRWQANVAVLKRDFGSVAGWPTELVADAAPYLGPVLWIAGERSRYITDEHAPAMEAYFPRVRRVTVKNAGHWVHSEQPAVFAEIMRQFLPAR